MISLCSRFFRHYHFVRPAISQIRSVAELEDHVKKRILALIENTNQARLNPPSFQQALTRQLHLAPTISQESARRTYHLSVHSPKTLEHHTIQASLTESSISVPNPQLFPLPFANLETELEHFSLKRGQHVGLELEEYKFDGKTAYLFNLPEQVNQQDIKAGLKSVQIESVRLLYCQLGLPAVAKVKFRSEQALNDSLSRLKGGRIEFGERWSFVKHGNEQGLLSLANRRVVVEIEAETNFRDVLLDFSKYGRVLHLDLPMEAWRNPTLAEVKQFYGEKNELVRITQVHPDGSIEPQYYPEHKSVIEGQNWQQIQLMDRSQKLRQNWEKRARFAREVRVEVGKEHQITIQHKGYCVVTFSTYQEVQNFYFAKGYHSKISLVGQRGEFEYDPSYKRGLLRAVDRQYLVGRKAIYEANSEDRKIDEATRAELEIYQQLALKMQRLASFQPLRTDSLNQNPIPSQNPYRIFRDYVQHVSGIKKQQKGLSFDELAEKQLYGRVLPRDPLLQKLYPEVADKERSREDELFVENDLISQQDLLQQRNLFYYRQMQRKNRIAGEIDRGERKEIEDIQPGQGSKRKFSTAKPRPLFRKRDVEEQAQYFKRLGNFIRQTIQEYLGLFRDQEIETFARKQPVLLNPQLLNFGNKRALLSEEDLPHVLQFSRNFAEAQLAYEDYVKGRQYIKSTSVDLVSLIGRFSELQQETIRHLTDFGLVEEVYRIPGEGAQEKVRKLNATEAGVGEEYRLEKTSEGHFLLLLKKLQHVAAIDRAERLEQFVAQNLGQITPAQEEIFKKYRQNLLKNGIVPEELAAAFGLTHNKLKLDDLLTEIGASHGIFKKGNIYIYHLDLELADRAKRLRDEDFKEDIRLQEKEERVRRRLRKVGSLDLAKDPSEIYVRDKEGYFKVSRFRQI